MKYLILFELGKKRFVESYVTRNNAVNAMNSYTKIADEVIESITELGKDKYEIIFEDGSKASFKIEKAANDSMLAYYPADLARIFMKLCNILLKRRYDMAEQAAKAEKAKKKARRQAIALILIGVAIMLDGFVVSALCLVPQSAAWQFALLGSVIALGFASTLRGGALMMKPTLKNSQPVLIKQNA